MKKQEITDMEMEQLFNKVIEQTPLINDVQVSSLLQNLNPGKPESSREQFIKTYLNTLIVCAVFLTIAIGSFLLIDSNHKNENDITQNISLDNQVQFSHPDTLAVNPIEKIDKESIPIPAQEDNPLKTSETKSGPMLNRPDSTFLLSDIYKHFDKKPQIFTIQVRRDTTLVCAEGTSISIKANSLVSEKTGKEISGEVQICVKEYYKLSDMLLNNLSTTSGNKLIETGGMIYLTATVNNENCSLKSGSNIEIGFPYSTKKEGMELFSGKWITNKIDWKPLNNRPKEQPDNMDIIVTVAEIKGTDVMQTTNFIVEQMPEFPGGVRALRSYIDRNIQYPYSALKDKITGKVFVYCLIDATGKPINISVIRGINTALDKAACYLVQNMPKWIPGRQNGQPVAVSYTIPINFSAKNGEMTNEEIMQSKIFEKEIEKVNVIYKSSANGNFEAEFENNVNDDNLNKTKVSDINRYLFSTFSFGWFNCDRFTNFAGQKTDFICSSNDPDSIKMQMVFHSIKSILPGEKQPNGFVFRNVAVGQEITIVAFKTKDQKVLLAVKEAVIKSNGEINLKFKQITMELLKSEMEKLDQLNK